MPVVLDRPRSLCSRNAGDIELGLLNLMPGSAGVSCERQVLRLLEKASGSARVRLRFFSLSAAASNSDTSATAASYDLQDLFGTRLDGLFVTGAEPKSARLPDEPFWSHLTDVVDWAQTHTFSTIWSCLSAHAAVLHLDGIERRQLSQKCSGAFSVEHDGEHPLVAAVASPARVFHSRWNEVEAAALTASGYTILTRGPVGVDSFVKTRGSRFVFFQGHPEYDASALGREYRRDVRRYLSGESDLYPTQPAGYFDAATSAALQRFEAAAKRYPSAMATRPLPRGTLEQVGSHTSFGESLFRNWLHMVVTHAREHVVA